MVYLPLILEALEREDGVCRIVAADIAGINDNTAFYALQIGLEHGLIAAAGHRRGIRYFLTERGKITLAIARGRAIRARAQMKAAA